MNLELWQWIFGMTAALLVGISKTGLPGLGILVVTLLAAVFGGRPSIGIMLPMLISADCFAMVWYRHHAQWGKLARLLPWVLVGMAAGTAALWATGMLKTEKDILGKIIGGIILIILALRLVQDRLGERLSPRSKIGIASTGASVGFATTVSNAAGNIMAIYLSAYNLPKKQFMGTIAWYFFVVNLSKLPIYVALTAINPEKPIITLSSLRFNLLILPLIAVGAFLGKWLLPRIPQRTFEIAVLMLAGIASVRLLVG